MLSGEQKKEIREALYDAFRTPGQMVLVVSDADLAFGFAIFLNSDTYEVALHNLIERVVADNTLTRLLDAAGGRTPGNLKLEGVRTSLKLKDWEAASKVVPELKVGPEPTPLGASDFDPCSEAVVKAICSRLDALKVNMVNGQNGQEMPLLHLVRDVLEAGTPSSGQGLSEHLTVFLQNGVTLRISGDSSRTSLTSYATRERSSRPGSSATWWTFCSRYPYHLGPCREPGSSSRDREQC